jgi:hypothetical protein
MMRTPRIDVALDTPPGTFFRRLAEVCEADSIPVVWGNPSTDPSNATFLAVRPATVLPHENLTGAFIRDPLATNRVVAQVSAFRWSTEPPDFDAYVAAAKSVLGAILRRYRQAFGAKCRLRIQRRSSLRPRLPKVARRLLYTFVAHANKSLLHELDWGPFYNFIHHCACRRVQLRPVDLQHLLEQRGLDEYQARHLADVYDHGRHLVRMSLR